MNILWLTRFWIKTTYQFGDFCVIINLCLLWKCKTHKGRFVIVGHLKVPFKYFLYKAVGGGASVLSCQYMLMATSSETSAQRGHQVRLNWLETNYFKIVFELVCHFLWWLLWVNSKRFIFHSNIIRATLVILLTKNNFGKQIWLNLELFNDPSDLVSWVLLQLFYFKITC